jgi:hypothetical protein
MPIDPSIYQGQTLANPVGGFLQGVAVAQRQKSEQDEGRLREAQLRQADDQHAAATREEVETSRLSDVFTRAAQEERDPTPGEIYSIVAPERGQKILAGLVALRSAKREDYDTQQKVLRDAIAGMHALPEPLRAAVYPTVRQHMIERGVITPQDAPDQYDPAWWAQTSGYGSQPARVGTREVKTRNPDGSETTQIVEDTPGQSFTSAPPVAAGKKYPVTVPGPDGRPVQRLVTEDELAAGVPAYRDPKTPSEPQKFWVMRNGQPLRVSEQEYRPGDLPASTREQGRPVTSGDANKIADLDTSLNDLGVLRGAVKDPGTISRIQSHMPTFVSELTGGWTDDAKQQNAVIARVRQVIGKALEGGVLRKEDEEKYKTILPVIGDSKAVALKKIEGLETALTQRRSTQLDALADAGYDVSKFQSREPTQPQAPAGKANPFRK